MNFTNDIEDLVYQSYLEIDIDAFQERIRYFERNRTAILQLPFEMKLEMSLDYLSALHEVGDHYQYLKHVDKLLEIVIADNIYSVDGDDIYQELLFRKASALNNTVDFVRAEHILGELVKIDPSNRQYRIAFQKNKVAHLRYSGQKMRAITIMAFLLTGLFIGIELLVVRPFFDSYVENLELLRNILFIFAVSTIIIQELRVRYLASRRLNKIIKSKLAN